MNIFLSIIIPCYNVQDYIEDCINSLAIQTKKDCTEYIFINDGSSDGTLSKLQAFAKKDSRVVIIDKANAGVSAARNDALKIARGKYVYFVDGDDNLTDNAIECIYNNLTDNSVDVLITNLYYAYPDRLVTYSTGIKPGTYSVNAIFNSCSLFPTPPQNIYRNSIIQEHNLRFNEELRVGEVYEFTISYLVHANKIKVIDECIYNYVMRESSATHRPNLKADATALDTIHELYRKGERYKDIPSFNLTAFKIATSFTYNKFVKYGELGSDSIDIVKQLLKDDTFKYILKNVAWGCHQRLKERCLAIYICITSIAGFKFLAMISKLIRK